MKIGTIGTGIVGATLGTKLTQLGHQVKMGSRNANNEKAIKWVNGCGPNASQGTFADAAAFGEIVFCCTKGDVALEALKVAGAENLNGKVLIDVSNPLDFSYGMPPCLIPSLCNTNSLGEEIQKTFPGTKVVKALNTMNCNLMVNPEVVAGSHDLFLCGNDESAKAAVTGILKSFGWTSIIDLGDLTGARAMEMLLPIWLRLMLQYKTPNFNFKIVK
jgi:8-hydroxy-5-deazaflavin:NADPH oxidoreductase